MLNKVPLGQMPISDWSHLSDPYLGGATNYGTHSLWLALALMALGPNTLKFPGVLHVQPHSDTSSWELTRPWDTINTAMLPTSVIWGDLETTSPAAGELNSQTSTLPGAKNVCNEASLLKWMWEPFQDTVWQWPQAPSFSLPFLKAVKQGITWESHTASEQNGLLGPKHSFGLLAPDTAHFKSELHQEAHTWYCMRKWNALSLLP